MKCPHCGKETDEAPAHPLASGATLESEFANWYSFYPRKVGRGAARTAYGRARKKTDAQTLMDGSTRYARLVEGREARFVCLPATWLNQERWADGQALTTGPVSCATPEEQIWGGLEQPLIKEVGLAAFNGWFYPAKLLNTEPITIGFVSGFKRDWVETHYQFQLKRAFGTYKLEVIS